MLRKILFYVIFFVLLSGCGGSGDSEATNPIFLSISGSVSGLEGTVELQNNAEDTLIINENGSFVFPLELVEGATYNVSVLTQPDAQTCVVTNGEGTVSIDSVINIEVNCSTNTYTIGATVSGLVGSLAIQNNGGDTAFITENGSFTFSTPLAQGAPYNVTVLTQPIGYYCLVTNGSGTLGGSNVTNVAIDCTENSPTLSMIAPNVGPITGGTAITITGTDLTNTTGVTFDGVAASGMIVVNSTTVTATTPAHAAGLVDVVVTTTGGTATLSSAYTYEPLQTLTVAKAGTGTGIVTSSPVGINCGATCSADYPKNTLVTLNAAAAVNQVFVGWSGACSGTGSCDVSMTSAQNVTATFDLGVPSLSASVSELILSVNDTTTSSYLTGNPRTITITNTGTATATNVSYTLSTALPMGATVTPASCGTLSIGATCVLTVTPSSIPTAAVEDLGALPIELSVSGDGTNTVETNISIVTYGSFIGGGYVFSVNDTVPNSGSIGVKVVSSSVVGSGVEWSTDVAGDVVFDLVPGISETSVTSPTSCLGGIDGVCNTEAILNFYPSVPTANYAAGTCAAYSGGAFSDWYLPAICELSYSNTAGCGSALSPTIQNIQLSLGDSDIGNYADELYWSSTSYSGDQTLGAWFNAVGPMSSNANNSPVGKSFAMKTICVRRF